MHQLATGMLLVTMAAAIILPGPGRHTRDYAFSGCRWPSGRIAYTDDTGRYGRATAAAARHWSVRAAPVQLHATPAAAWTVTTANLGPTQVYGLTHWTCDRGRFTSVVSYYNTYYTDGFTFEQRVSLMTHEMGHGLGLSHGSASGGCPVPIMTPNFSDTWGRCHEAWPQAADIEGVVVLYGGASG
jgi:matrixin